MNEDTPLRPLSLEAFEPRQSIWELIQGQAIEEERSDIKKLIGSSLIEETVDLHKEVNTLLEIWREFRDETDKLQKGPSLPEPPNVRENLIKQIKLFVKLMQERSAQQKRGLTRALSPHQSELVTSVCDRPDEKLNLLERPRTARSCRDGRQTPLRVSVNRSQSSGSNDHFSDIHEVTSSDKIEELADIIREDLEEERTSLHADIDFLQQCLMDESMYQTSLSTQNEPSLKELQEIGLKLEKELLIFDTPSKESPIRSAPPKRTQDGLKTRMTNQKPSSETSPRRVVPSPPSSAPSLKSRTSITQRKHLAAKVMQFPSDDTLSGSSGGQRSGLYQKNHVLQAEGSVDATGPKKAVASTSLTAPCVVNSLGSNSRKLRQLVLDSRETNS